MAHLLQTIGHSTRTIEEFIGLLQAHGVQLPVDVRAIPFSRRNPQFNTEALAESLARANLRYHRLPALGGRRKSRADSINLGWRNTGFRGYADYMQTAPFWAGIEELLNLAANTSIAIMCAEAVPWRCHRSLIADAVVSQGLTVRHILTRTEADPHILTSFARLDQGRLYYPKLQASPERSPAPAGRSRSPQGE